VGKTKSVICEGEKEEGDGADDGKQSMNRAGILMSKKRGK
jgi:hypothetical protein